MSCQLEVVAINGQPGPERFLKLAVSLRWIASGPAQLLNLQGRLRFNNAVICPSIAPEMFHFGGNTSADLIRDRPISGTMLAPISPNSIRWIEESRGANDVPLAIELQYAWQDTPRPQEAFNPANGRVYWETMQSQRRISRSDWLMQLKELQWQDYEIFEISTLPLLNDPNLDEALKRLRQAQDALRHGDPATVLAACHKAFESAAKFHAQSDNVKQGFEVLLQSITEQENKRAKLNELIKALRDYSQFGRHENYPPVRITRAEAEFVLASSVGLFSLISRRLAKAEDPA
jgi:hypothetical protein